MSGERELSLAHLTVLDATPPELVSVAAKAGFRTVGARSRGCRCSSAHNRLIKP